MPEKDKKIILVTGGAGFIGSNLIERLMKQGRNEVYSLDNYFTGQKHNHIPGATYIEGHTKDIATLVRVKPDVVYHLGEYSRVAKSIEEPDLVWDLNLKGTAAVLEFCRTQGVKLVYAGSSTKFAEARSDGTEGSDLSPYTWAKAANSDLVSKYGKWYDLPHAIVYFYNVYGPRELSGVYGTAIEIFRKKFLKGEPLEVRLPGTQERNYTHVEDTVSALILVGEAGEGDGYGIGPDKSYSIKEVADLFGGEIVMLPERATSRPSSPIDSTRTRALGWAPTRTLEEYVASIKQEKDTN